MKLTLLTLTTILTIHSFGQKLSKNELQLTIAKETCDCIANKEVTRDTYEMSLGFCILEGIDRHEKDVEKYYGKDIISNHAKMEEIGRDIGFKMAGECPEAFSILLEDQETTEEEYLTDEYVGEEGELTYDNYEEMDMGMSSYGKVIEIRPEGFLKLRIREESGKINEFIVLNEFDDSYLITDKVLVLSDVVTVNYYETVLYDVTLNKFISYKVVSGISKD